MEGRYLNDKGFLIPTADAFLLAALNSPLLWWFNWRHLAHLKDEALTPQGYRVETIPVARPDAATAERAAAPSTIPSPSPPTASSPPSNPPCRAAAAPFPPLP